MNYIKSLRFEIITLSLISLCIIIVYWNLPDTFFQQDEWWTFGLYNAQERLGGLGYFIKEAFTVFDKTHYTPLSELGFYSQYKLFDLNFPFYAYLSISLHIINTIMVFIFTQQVVKNRLISFLSSLLFAINSIPHQAVSWISASLNTQSATFFLIVFCILFLQFLRNEQKNKKLLILSLFPLVIGLLFKETITAFLLVPLLYFIYREKISVTAIKKVFTPFVFFLPLYLLLRFIMYLKAPPIFGSDNVELVQAGIAEYIFRILALPFRSIAQSLIPADYLLSISESLIRLSYPHLSYSDGSVDGMIRETVGYDLICLFISVLVLSAAFFSYRYFKNKNKYFSKAIILFLLITILSPLLIIFIPGKAGYASLIEPRHLYPGSFGAVGLLVLTLFGLLSKINKNKSKIISILIVFTIVVFNIWKIKGDISELEETGNLRKNLLTEIASAYPHLPKSAIIYTESNKSYYGMPDAEKILPVQVGFGWILLVWYHQNEHFPACLYDTKLFLDILAQGYKECEGRGFGYFRDYNKLIDAVSKNNIGVEDIVAYNWDSKSGEFTNISLQIKDRVKNDLKHL